MCPCGSAVHYLPSMPIHRLAPILLALAACGKAADRGNPACGLAALAGPTALLTQFSVPRQTLSAAPARLPEHLVARVVAGPALPAIVGRADSQLVIKVLDQAPDGRLTLLTRGVQGLRGGPAGARPDVRVEASAFSALIPAGHRAPGGGLGHRRRLELLQGLSGHGGRHARRRRGIDAHFAAA